MPNSSILHPAFAVRSSQLFCGLSLSVCALVFGCSSKSPAEQQQGGSGAAAGSAGSGSSGSSGSGGAPGLFGTFNVEFREASAVSNTDAYSYVRGQIYDGPVPETTPMIPGPEDSGCQLFKPNIPFCDPPCSGGTETLVCVEGNRCVGYPKPQNAGSARVTGLAGGELSLEPFKPKFDYQSPALAYPACDEGADVSVETPAFRLQSRCVAPLSIPDSAIAVRRDEPVRLTWNVPGDPTLARVHLRLDVSHHGGKKGEIDCDVADTGSFEIPAGLVTSLVDLGLAGFPTISVTRSLSAAAAAEKDVSLTITSSIERVVDTGVTSCVEDSDCPSGQTCDVNLTCK